MIKVLLVDDESWNRELIRSLGSWEELGMEVLGEAEDGLQALSMIEGAMPHIVITDMRMPGADGVRLMQSLHDRFPDIQIIVVSGHDDFRYAQSAVRYGAADYLLKPIDPRELNAVLAKCRERLESGGFTRSVDVSLALAECKRLLKVHFNELSLEGIEADLRQLAREMEQLGLGRSADLRQAAQELLVLLQELLVVNQLEADYAVSAAGLESSSSWEQTALLLIGVYSEALSQLIQQRKYKNRLNLDEVRQYIDSHFAEAVTLESLSRSFFVSREYLSKMFKQRFGQGVTDYILDLRMEKAKAWLRDESVPIKTVAEMAGYEDVTYFYRVFKKYFGVAPGEMRRGGPV